MEEFEDIIYGLNEEDDDDSFSFEDYDKLNKDITNLENLKKAFNAKIRSDVNWIDVEELQNVLRELGLEFQDFESYSKEIIYKYWGSNPAKNTYGYSSYGIKLLVQNYRNKQALSLEDRDALEKELEEKEQAILPLKEQVTALENKVDELSDKRREIRREYEDKIYDIEDKLDDQKRDIVEAFKALCRKGLSYCWLIYNLYMKLNGGSIELNSHRMRFVNQLDSTNSWYFSSKVSEMVDVFLKHSDEIPAALEEMKNFLSEENHNRLYDTPFNKWKNFFVRECIRDFQGVVTAINSNIINNTAIINKIKEINSLREKKESECDKIDDEIEEIESQIFDLRSNPEYAKLRDRISELRKRLSGGDEWVPNNLLYDKEFIDNYVLKSYLKYLVKILSTYIDDKLKELNVIKGRFGIGNGTGNALTRFRNFRNRMNDQLTASEKAMFIGWLCKHIRGMEVAVKKDGSSEKIFNMLFPEILNYDTSKKAGDNAWDAPAGEITIDSASNITPEIQALFNKVTALKTQLGINNEDEETGKFNGNKLQSIALVYFLLKEYHSYGFDLGKIEIEPEEAYVLQRAKFPDNEEDFNTGYNS